MPELHDTAADAGKPPYEAPSIYTGRRRWLIVLSVLAAYALSFPTLYASSSAIVAAFSVVPVSVAGGLLGVRSGLSVGLFCIPLNMVLFSLVDVSGWYMLVRYWPGTVAFLAAGVLCGWLRDTINRSTECSFHLSRETERLEQEIAERHRVEQMLKQAHAELELRIEERTAQLKETNRQLVREIEERTQVENELRANEQIYRTLVETSPSAITLSTIDGAILFANTQALLLFGAKGPDEVTGRHLLEWVAPEDRLPAGEMFARLVAGEVLRGVTLRMFRREQTLFWSEICASRIKLQGMREDLLLVLSSDVTERKQAEQALLRSQEEQRSLAAHLEMVRETERKDIAREIHDELGQSLTALKYDISWLGKRLPEQAPPVAKRIASMGELIDATIRSVQRISSELRPRLLDELGLSAAIEWQVQEFTGRSGIPCNMQLNLEEVDLTQECSTALYRILQEALTNILRHAGATEIDLSLIQTGRYVRLVVTDNGKGIMEQKCAAPLAFGLMGMRERARICGGSVTITGMPGRGTTVEVSLPVSSEEIDHAENPASR